jgi:hypothetical protein
VRNPVRSDVRTQGVAVRGFLALAVVALLGAAGAARADNPALSGSVGLDDAFVISLVDASGARVTHLDPGTYTLTVADHSDFHNFHLTGPGVDVSTTPEFVGTQTFTITLSDGTYAYQCDPHSSRMHGTFTVGVVTTPPPPVAPQRAEVSVGSTAVSFPRGLKAGPVRLVVHDRSRADGYLLRGPGVAKSTAARFTGTVTWSVTLRAGSYTVGSAKRPRLRRIVTISSA